MGEGTLAPALAHVGEPGDIFLDMRLVERQFRIRSHDPRKIEAGLIAFDLEARLAFGRNDGDVQLLSVGKFFEIVE